MHEDIVAGVSMCEEMTANGSMTSNMFTSREAVKIKSKEGDEIEYSFTLTPQLHSTVEEHIAVVLDLASGNVQESSLRAHIYAIAGLVWHDRDAEIFNLRSTCQQAYEELSKVKRQDDPDKISQDAQRMVVVSSATPDTDLFVAAVKKPEWILEYDFDTMDIADLSKAVEEKARELKPWTVAFANHGADEKGIWSITKDCSINVKEGKPEVTPPLADFFKSLARAANYRVDLLACDLASEPGGLALIQELEAETGKNIAASTNHTGNLKRGGDWVLETDNVDTASIYFDTNALYKWEGLLWCQRAAKDRLRTHDENMQVLRRLNTKRIHRSEGIESWMRGPLKSPYSDSESDTEICRYQKKREKQNAEKGRLKQIRDKRRQEEDKKWGNGRGGHH
eukprot:gnl/TRDRNA2_/TRDRNA2_141690_c1_seq4.p1 gnl/TRDRNA2_/TRDRNA2_141690_c1~~gnl/TRDRNA2_/TRDRNA2_141690_c1_seq4.p1  ORF type:complete len:436 (-),score=94.81 gnl/TRDRNA2_/TRDRNA2_141690_c1_seq4:40-1224(-)